MVIEERMREREREKEREIRDRETVVARERMEERGRNADIIKGERMG